MQEDTKISDLTVAEFRQLMQQCFDRDRALESQRELARRQANPAISRRMQANPFGSPYGGVFGD